MSSLTLRPSKTEVFNHGKSPPAIQGKFLRFKFPDEESIKKDFIDKCLRFPCHMYKKLASQKKLKKSIQQEYAKNESLTGYVHKPSKYIRSSKERKHKWYKENKYREIKGYQYYTIEFNFSNGLYELTSDVLLFIQILEHEEITTNYWALYLDIAEMEILD